MMKKNFLIIFLLLGIIGIPSLYGQVTIGADKAPDENAVLELVSNDSKGLLLPRLELISTIDPDPLSEHVEGMVVYNIGSNIPQGYYYNDGSRWMQVVDTDSAPWRVMGTANGATSNTEDIYQIGAVTVGAGAIDDNAQFEVTSNNKGILIPRLTTGQRDAIVNPSNGLFIYNINTNCFNYYDGDASRWVSLCGTYEPSNFEIVNCSDPSVGPSGIYMQGTSLTSSNTYTIIVRVIESGNYQALLTSGNGYSFSKSGTFTEPGIYTLKLEGMGVPNNGNISGDVMTVYLNGTPVTPLCSLPVVPVVPSSVSFTVSNCNGVGVNGTYMRGKALDGSHYVTVPILVGNPGTTVIETTTVNGFKFSSGSIALESSTTSVTLYAEGAAPLAVGSYNYTIIGTGCSFPVNVGSNLGTYNNPAPSCLAIYNEDNTRPDGEYWISYNGTSKTAVKTRCDMTNGGYTLLWSYSEKAARYEYGDNDEMKINSGLDVRMQANLERHNVKVSTSASSEPSTAVNYRDHRLSKNTMTTVRRNSTGQYRVFISNSPTDLNDRWAAQNRMEFIPGSKIDPILGDESHEDGHSSLSRANLLPTSRVFGKIVYGSTSAAEQYVMNGVNGEMRFYSDASYGAHWDHTTTDGWPKTKWYNDFPVYGSDTEVRTLSYNPHDFNNLFGWHAESDINHHFGKCEQYGDDYSFSIESCRSKERYPHSFNGGEGRYLQWWVK